MSKAHQIEPDLAVEVSALKGLVDRLLRIAEGGIDPSQTIPQFCAGEGFSRAQYYVMRKQGRGPREMRIGNGCIRITPEARRDWRLEREAETARSR
jgi:hypothetical protein